MRQLAGSFRKHLGQRGCHFYNEEGCNFLPWNEVLSFLDVFDSKEEDEFSDRLLDTLSNYDPDREFLAVRQEDDTISVELYSESERYSR